MERLASVQGQGRRREQQSQRSSCSANYWIMKTEAIIIFETPLNVIRLDGVISNNIGVVTG
jgi:hypothetical protein